MPLLSGDSYGSVSDFSARFPSSAWGARTVVDVQAALARSTSDMDDCFRGVYGVGFVFLSVGASVAGRCADHARYLFVGGRGFSPETDSDKDLVAAEAEFQTWIDKVQRRVIFPDVTIDRDPNFGAQPIALSSSVVDDNGRRCATRGW